MIVSLGAGHALRRAAARRQSLVAIARPRVAILILLFAAAMLTILGQLTVLAAAGRAPVAPAAQAETLRGDIFDRNGVPLARTLPGWSIGMHPDRVIGDRAALADQLAILLPARDAAAYRRALTPGARFAYLQQGATPAQVRRVNALGEPGIVFAREPQRIYPQAALAAHAIGFVDRDGHGQLGIERALDGRLAGAEPVRLSIDIRVQSALDNELRAAMASLHAIAAAGVILDVDSGEILAMTSLPDFDPNRIRAADRALRNNVTQSVYELGSTFKPLTMALAIDSGVVPSLAQRFDATRPIAIGPFTIHDDHPEARWLNIPEILVHSSNIATARVADLLGGARLRGMFAAFGFDAPPPIELRERARSLLPANWGRTGAMTAAYGHGVAVTPLHLANAYAALVNGGIWRPSTLIAASDSAPPGRRVLSASTSALMRALLRLVVLEGTGRNGDAPGYRVGGKTGTAEKAAAGGYSRTRNVSTFAAAFPMDAPRFVVVAMLDSPVANAASAGQATAGWTAAPVVRRLIARVGPMLGVAADMHRDMDVSRLTPLLWRGPAQGARVIRKNPSGILRDRSALPSRLTSLSENRRGIDERDIYRKRVMRSNQRRRDRPAARIPSHSAAARPGRSSVRRRTPRITLPPGL